MEQLFSSSLAQLTFLQDRRPITPPPCVRLIITDIATGKEVDVKYDSASPRLYAS